MSVSGMDLGGLTVDDVTVGIYRDITFRCRVNVQRVAFEAKDKVSFLLRKKRNMDLLY